MVSPLLICARVTGHPAFATDVWWNYIFRLNDLALESKGGVRAEQLGSGGAGTGNMGGEGTAGGLAPAGGVTEETNNFRVADNTRTNYLESAVVCVIVIYHQQIGCVQ